MSHELRTPLNAILGFTQLLELDAGRSERDLESLRHITHAGRHLLTLIDEVLDISRIETGRLVLAIETVDVAEVLEEALALIRPLADRRRIALVAEWGERRAVHAHADRQRLSQILLNLLSNAVKYNLDGGRAVATVVRGAGGTARIGVTDTGAASRRTTSGGCSSPSSACPPPPATTRATGSGSPSPCGGPGDGRAHRG